MTMSRRGLLKAAGAGAAFASSGFPIKTFADALPMSNDLLPGVRGEAVLDALPGKKPLLKLTYRPPNYETPLPLLNGAITPNDTFFVRYHLADIPEQIDAKTWRLKIGGDGMRNTAELTYDQLKRLSAHEVTAVCQCSGNRRGLFMPHVAGVQWGYGAMGCARFKGARLKDVLAKAGLKSEAIEVVFNAPDGPVAPKTPDFAKSIPISKALDDNTLIAYEMNGQPLPHWNGFPARIIVPGWTATYWVKHVDGIDAITKPFDGFWVKSAYRIPSGKFPTEVFKSQDNPTTTPITQMVVNSIVTSHLEGAKVRAGSPATITGVSWDGGSGIKTVEYSTDGGKSWKAAQLGTNNGPYAFRTFNFTTPSLPAGTHKFMVKATSNSGETQVDKLIFNGAGYHHNVVQTLTLNAA